MYTYIPNETGALDSNTSSPSGDDVRSPPKSLGIRGEVRRSGGASS